MSKVSVVRKPIKIRRPIQKDYCNCYDIRVLSSRGKPYVCNIDNLTADELSTMLEGCNVVVPMMTTEPLEYSRGKLNVCLSRGIPVFVSTSVPLPMELVEQVSRVPRSTIQISTDFLGEKTGKGFSNGNHFSSLLPMLHLAKSRKISQVLELYWAPHVMHMYDIFEITDMFKNYVSHIAITFPEIADAKYHLDSKEWDEATKEKFKGFYEPDVPNRSWRVKEWYQKEFVSAFLDFIKSKKLTMEVVSWSGQSNRIRHDYTGSANPLGMKPLIYVKDEQGMFKELHESEHEGCVENPCGNCGRTKFL